MKTNTMGALLLTVMIVTGVAPSGDAAQSAEDAASTATPTTWYDENVNYLTELWESAAVEPDMQQIKTMALLASHFEIGAMLESKAMPVRDGGAHAGDIWTLSASATAHGPGDGSGCEFVEGPTGDFWVYVTDNRGADVGPGNHFPRWPLADSGGHVAGTFIGPTCILGPIPNLGYITYTDGVGVFS